MKRVYVEEERRFMQEKAYEMAQNEQRLKNAFDWYQGSGLKVHLDSMKATLAKMGAIVEELEARQSIQNPSHVVDPERDV